MFTLAVITSLIYTSAAKHKTQSNKVFISETLILWSLQMYFSYLQTLQRQWVQDVNSILNLTKTSGPVRADPCFIRDWSLLLCRSWCLSGMEDAGDIQPVLVSNSGEAAGLKLLFGKVLTGQWHGCVHLRLGNAIFFWRHLAKVGKSKTTTSTSSFQLDRECT